MNKHRILLVGYGMLGGWFGELACKAFFSQNIPATLVVCDDDTYEDRNAGNQNVDLMDGLKATPKVDLAERTAKRYKVPVVKHNTRLVMDNMLDIAEGCTLIVDAVDNVPTRQLLHMLGKALGIPVMHLGISKKGIGQVNWTTKDWHTFPYTVEALAGRELKDDNGGGEPPCEMFAHLGNGINLATTAVKAMCLFFGKDPWKSSAYLVSEAAKGQGLGGAEAKELVQETVADMGPLIEIPGMMTCWETWPNGSKLVANELTTVDGFYPVVEGV